MAVVSQQPRQVIDLTYDKSTVDLTHDGSMVDLTFDPEADKDDTEPYECTVCFDVITEPGSIYENYDGEVCCKECVEYKCAECDGLFLFDDVVPGTDLKWRCLDCAS